MNQTSQTPSKRLQLSLKDALFIGFCSVFAVLLRVAMRLKLHINGHSMLPTVFFLMLARGSVQYPFAATFAGFLAGTAAIFLGFAKSGPFIVVMYVATGLVIDLLAFVMPRAFQNFLFAPLIGAAAGGTKFFTTYARNFMIGMDPVVNFQNSLIEAGGAILFGTLAGLAVPVVIRRLKAYGVI
jgi:hypothetical protein